MLLRFDALGRHTNPDGKSFDGPHVHIYKDGYDDKFAFSVSEIGIDENNLQTDAVLIQFLTYCNIVNCPKNQLALFNG